MKPISFLTEEEIQKLQEAEASSNKEQKKSGSSQKEAAANVLFSQADLNK